MIAYKLLTPGPLTTTESVKREMLVDHCTWDDDYKQITQRIRSELLELAHVSPTEYTVVLMQGSGTFGVESVLISSVGKSGKVLILSNGAYGERQEDICKHAGIDYAIQHFHYNEVPDASVVEHILVDNPDITHVSMVHSETTSGILNDIEAIAKVVKKMDKVFIVDAMSSFGGIEIPVADWGIDFIISSANKCIQGVPGFSFIICRIDELQKCEGKAVSLSLDLFDQWKGMHDGKWRFTSPTHVVLAFAKAIEEMKAEGGIPARNKRYTENEKLLVAEMSKLGYKTYIDALHQGPIITTFLYPDNANYTFKEMYEFIKERGYAIYPGKVTEAETFRIGTIGEIYKEDIEKLITILKEFLGKQKYSVECDAEYPGKGTENYES